MSDENNAALAQLFADMEKADPHDVATQEALTATLFIHAAEEMKNYQPTPRDAVSAELQTARQAGDWPTAEDACRRLLALDEGSLQAIRTWGYLAEILGEQGRMAEAYAAARAATQAAGERNILPLRTTALENEMLWAEKLGEHARAAACIDEALALLVDQGPSYDWKNARLLVLRARLRLRAGEHALAAQDLAAAEPVLTPYASSMMLAGPLSSLRLWWHTAAQLRQAKGDTEAARAAANEALWLSRRLAEQPQHAEHDRQSRLRRALEQFAELREALGDTEAAEAARQEASAIK